MSSNPFSSDTGPIQRLNFRQRALRNKILREPYYRLQTREEVAIAAELGIRIDVHQASVDDWLRLPGISIHQARSLVELVRMGVQLLCLEDLAAALGVSVRRLQPLEPLLYFSYYDPESLITPQPVNPNTASREELEQIPGMEPDLVNNIRQNRQENGAYRNLADFQRRLGLSGQLISQLMHYLQF
jgi:DNA uptake protein ComE-like DNA-binding protein